MYEAEDDVVAMGCYFGTTLDRNYTGREACTNDGGEWKPITTPMESFKGSETKRAKMTSKAKTAKSTRPKTKRAKTRPAKPTKKTAKVKKRPRR